MAKLKNINIRFTIIKIIKHREDLIMKTLIKFAVIPMLLLSACSSSNQLSSAYDDDGIYTSKKEKPLVAQTPTVAEKAKPQIAEQKPVTYNEVTPKSYNANEAAVDKSQMSYDKYKQSQVDNANPIVENNTAAQTEAVNTQENQNYSNYDADDYYDYGYSSRLRRFHNPCHFSGYYDDYYTNMYWYNHDPFYYGTSIYMGYNWFGPDYSYYNPYYYNNWGWNFGFGLGLGWGSYGMGYYGWNTPYWGGGYYGYGGYGHGHGHGFNNDNWASNHRNSAANYFGPRNGIGASNGTTTPRGSGTTTGGIKSTNQRFSSTDNTSKRTTINIGSNDIAPTPIGSESKKAVPVLNQNENISPVNPSVKANDSKAVNPTQDNRIVNTPANNERKVDANIPKVELQNNAAKSNTAPTNQNNPNTRINNYQRYSRSNQEKQIDKAPTTTPNTYNYRDPKSYNSPSYSQPRSSQEFESPKYKSERSYSTQPAQTQPSNIQETPRSNTNRNYSQPAPNQNRNYTPPSTNQERNYSPPTNNENRNYTPPANTERKSQPSNNNSNYSTPAPNRSNNSAPSNSGGNNSRSSGSSSGSGNQHKR